MDKQEAIEIIRKIISVQEKGEKIYYISNDKLFSLTIKGIKVEKRRKNGYYIWALTKQRIDVGIERLFFSKEKAIEKFFGGKDDKK